MAPWLGGAVRKKCRDGKADQSPGRFWSPSILVAPSVLPADFGEIVA
jgi:hypothetical protein